MELDPRGPNTLKQVLAEAMTLLNTLPDGSVRARWMTCEQPLDDFIDLLAKEIVALRREVDELKRRPMA